MNPLNNRWILIISVIGLLLIVAELVGSEGSVLSRMANSGGPGAEQGMDELPEGVERPTTIIDEVGEDDLPQPVYEADAEDDFVVDNDLSEFETADDQPMEDSFSED